MGHRAHSGKDGVPPLPIVVWRREWGDDEASPCNCGILGLHGGAAVMPPLPARLTTVD